MALDESEKALSLATVRRDTLLQQARTLQISTSSESGEYIEWGVAPYIRRNNLFYIYVSELGGHVRFMLDKRPVLFSIIEDEKATHNIWARIRLKFTAEISEIMRGEAEFNAICDEIADHHGPVMTVIREFSDFHLFAINPKKGVIVTGFGSAFNVTGNDFKLVSKLSSNG